jgi:superfamily II DNA/RNA helicase
MKQLMKNPIGITPKQEIPVLLGIKQFVIVQPKEVDNILLMKSKIDELQNIFTRITFKQCMLFTDSQSKTESYGNYLNKVGWKNEVINGAQDQVQRLDVLDKLINFKCRILITTDLMARGIDIENINLIVNLDLPYDCFTYLHRIGRAGRFGSHGIAITFVNGEEDLDKFQKMLGDIGGNSVKAMKYPDESEPYDFWNFHDVNHLDTVSGVSSNDVDIEVNIEEKIAKKNSTENKEQMMNNLALLEITRKLVDDDESKKLETFDLDDLLKDYEQMEKNEPEKNEVHNDISANSCDNIFLKTIEDLQLYENDEKSSEESVTNVIEEQRHVIFKRIDTNIGDENLSDLSSKFSDTEMSEDEIEPERNQKIPTVQSFEPKSSYNPYNQYVSANYSQWENIYRYQLANIQNYIQNAK